MVDSHQHNHQHFLLMRPDSELCKGRDQVLLSLRASVWIILMSASCLRHVCFMSESCLRRVCIMSASRHVASRLRHICVTSESCLLSCLLYICVMSASCLLHVFVMSASCLRSLQLHFESHLHENSRRVVKEVGVALCHKHTNRASSKL